jgi:hypothetical protein
MLNAEQLQILDGAMLGDGSLIIHKNGKNAYFSYLSSKKDHVEYVFNSFRELCNYAEVKCDTYTDKRTSKAYTRYHFRTRSLPCLTEVYEKWYDSDGRKFIRRDINLSAKTILLWYLGDGHLARSGNSPGFIKLATNCFTRQDLEATLLPKMVDFDARINYSDDNPIIIIPRRRVETFLEAIGSCPVESYQYKWDYVPYTYTKYENGIDRFDETTISKILEQYQSGISYYRISKDLGCEPNRVKYHIESRGILEKGRDKLKPKFTSEQLDTISVMRQNGESWKAIGQSFGVDYRLILYYIRKREKNEKG